MQKIMRRFVDIWKPDFLAAFFTRDFRDRTTTILFWITSNLVVAAIFGVSLTMYLGSLKAPMVSFVEEEFHADASVAIQDGQLMLTNIEEPYFREVTASNAGSGASGDFVFIIDTTERVYNITTLDQYSAGVIALRDRVYIKDGVDMQQHLYSEIPTFAITRSDVITIIDRFYNWAVAGVAMIVLVVMFFFFAVIRLIAAFWWALMLWIFTRIMDVKASYGMAYMAVLNLYFIPTVIIAIMSQFVLTPPFFTTAIFVAIFVVNLWWIRRNALPESEAPAVPQEHTESEKAINSTASKE
jgi:hypothetical protein